MCLFSGGGGLGFKVQGLRFKVCFFSGGGLGFKVQGLRFKVCLLLKGAGLVVRV